ncbi:hypothetical protein OU415_13240 [Saccharopolyspora sp. WRP15-2]|uniref:Major facilitator superfamily (MFS) profile domain-containing protein n=1 Tax=Saccharopolyspora oryzae TaxID=2997343 RepID=A0ABT4UXJ0_9PSEU|nr:hypothetical protein [Saccharopolyspora oryzae]MDA3626405.1 hypothetical protein [Saccharopolyspora oryzae]
MALGHALGWPAFIIGLGAWGISVAPFAAWKAQGADLLQIDQSLVGFGVIIYGFAAAIGLGLLAAAMGVRHTVTQILFWIYLLLLFVGVVVAFSGTN